MWCKKVQPIGQMWRPHLNFNNQKNASVLNRNILLKVLIGTGKSTYFNPLTSDGRLDAYSDGLVTSIINSGASGNIRSFSFVPDSLGLTTFTASALLDFYKEGGGNQEVAYHLNNLITAGGALGGGVGAMIAPAQIFYGFLSYLSDGFAETSKGAHLIYHYFFGAFNNGVVPSGDGEVGEGGEIGFAAFASYAPSRDLAQDPIFIALRNHAVQNYPFLNAATDLQIQAAYGISSLFQTIERMNIDLLKREIAAYLYLLYLQNETTNLDVERLYSDQNEFQITIQDLDDPDHGGLPVSAEWFCTPESGSELNLTDSAYVAALTPSDLSAIPGIFYLNLQAVTALQTDGQLRVELTYSNSTIKTGSADLDYLPQHSSVTLSAGGIEQTTGGTINFDVTLTGDIEYDRATFLLSKIGGFFS